MPFTSCVKQKLLTAVILAVSAALLVTVIYTYERYYRGPSESAFYGTWREEEDAPSGPANSPVYWEFHPDQTFSRFLISSFDRSKISLFEGRWYAGGQNLYLRFTDDNHVWSHRP